MPPPGIAVFAHNEEGRIGGSLESLLHASRDALSVRVLVNGSSDGTERIVRGFAASHSNVECVVIDRGDKANAWNHYVHGDLHTDRNHYFLDGDCTLPAGCIDALEAEFAAGRPLCVAPLPRNVSPKLRAFLTQWSLPCGTLYGLAGGFLKRIVEDGIRMPVGFIGDDNLIASLVHSDLDDRFGDYDRSRVRIVESTGPIVHRPWLFSVEMFKLQRRRLRRYALRRVQMELLNHHVKLHGLRSLPTTAAELSRHWRAPGLGWYLKWRGPETPYVWRAMLRVRREAREVT